MVLHDMKLDPFCSKFYGPSLKEKENGWTDASLHVPRATSAAKSAS